MATITPTTRWSISATIERLIRWADDISDPPVQLETEEEIVGMFAERDLLRAPMTIAVVSPKGGVGKTTCAFLLGNLFAAQLNRRVVAVDATPELGMLSRLAPKSARSDRCLIELMEEAANADNVAALRPYLSCLPSGLQLLAAPRNAAVARRLGPGHYDALIRLLRVFYEVVLLDLGTGLSTPLARFAAQSADQLVVVTTPESHTIDAVLASIADLPADRTTVVLNMAQSGTAWDQDSIEARLHEHGVARSATVPFDEGLLEDLDGGRYEFGALDHRTRAAIVALGATVAGRG